MQPNTQLIDMMEEQACALRTDLATLESAIATLKRLAGVAVPLLEAPNAPRDSKPPKLPKKVKASASLPEGVNPETTLEPDYTINEVPLFFTDKERLLFDTLNDAAEGKYVSRDDCMKGAGLEKQSVLYVLLHDLKKKLAAAHCTIENAHGVGYRLVTAAA